MPDPTLWWNVLQDQFKQAVTSAMSSEAMTNAGAMAQEAASMMSAAATPKPASSRRRRRCRREGRAGQAARAEGEGRRQALIGPPAGRR